MGATSVEICNMAPKLGLKKKKNKNTQWINVEPRSSQLRTGVVGGCCQ